MELLSQIEDLKSRFDEVFNPISLEYKLTQISEGKIHSFFISAASSYDLGKEWRKISNFIAVNFQNQLENDFEIWNIYIFYKINFFIENSLKYQIENDIFSSRKIIIEDQISNEEIICEHIINSDLTIEINKLKEEFRYNPTIWNILKDKVPKKKITEEDKKAFKEIVEYIKKQPYEN